MPDTTTGPLLQKKAQFLFLWYLTRLEIRWLYSNASGRNFLSRKLIQYPTVHQNLWLLLKLNYECFDVPHWSIHLVLAMREVCFLTWINGNRLHQENLSSSSAYKHPVIGWCVKEKKTTKAKTSYVTVLWKRVVGKLRPIKLLTVFPQFEIL